MVIDPTLLKKTIRALESSRSKAPHHNNNKEKIFIPCPYYDQCSIILANKNRKLIQILNQQIIFEFKAGYRISSLFGKTYRCNTDNNKVIYGYSCYNSNGYYIGETARGAEVRKKDHMKAFNDNGYSRIAEHCVNKNHHNIGIPTFLDWNQITQREK
jgi:hypothetical protein